MRRLRLSALCALFPALLLYGCEGVAVTLLGVSTGVAASTAISYTLDGIAYRTFTATRENVRLAALKALSRMGMKLENDSKRGGRDFIVASGQDRKIEIELEVLAGRTTRINTVAKYGFLNIFRDRATST
ncbi:MAG: DUF3568 family protein, partial [Candidatus Tectomicrobia bacterium]|nr:DUF3568 family protein [Candidatus Tectomicrobia bacterium]